MIARKNVEIPLNLIITNPKQPRKIFTEEELYELKSSIETYGVLQPILVKRDKTGKFLLIAGERRLRAARLAGLDRIPAVVRNFDDKDAAVISIIENIQRENLSFIEEAMAYKNVIDNYKITQGELALRIGKKQSTISNKLRILALPRDIQEKLINNSLTERHGRALLKIDDPSVRNKILDRIIHNNLNVKQTEKLINEWLEKSEKIKKKGRTLNYFSYKIYVNTIKKAFSQIKDVEKRAKIIESDRGEYMEVKIIIPKNKECFT